MMERDLSISDAARLLAISRQNVRLLADRGLLPGAYRLPFGRRDLRIPPSAIEHLRSGHQVYRPAARPTTTRRAEPARPTSHDLLDG